MLRLHFFVAFFFIFSCTQKEEDIPFPKNYAFGVIQTATNMVNTSAILLYDEAGVLIHEKRIPFGGMWKYSETPSITEQGLLYLPVQGIENKGEKKTIELDLYTGKHRYFEIDYWPNTFFVKDNNIYEDQ